MTGFGFRDSIIVDETTGDAAEVNTDKQLETRSIIGDNTGANLVLKPNLSLPVTPVADYFIDVACNCIPGTSTQFKFGRSTAVTATESVIWDGGGTYTFLSAPETLDLVSDDAQDNAAGTGARSIIIYGLDVNYNEISEVVIPTGIVPVTTLLSFFRVYRAIVITSGTSIPIGNANAGNITISGSTTATTLAIIQQHNGQTLMSPFTVPAGKTFYVTGISASCGQGKNVLLLAKARNGPDSSYAFSIKYTLELYESAFSTLLQTPLPIPEKTDICWTGVTTAGTVTVSASYGGLIIDD